MQNLLTTCYCAIVARRRMIIAMFTRVRPWLTSTTLLTELKGHWRLFVLVSSYMYVC